MFCVWWGKRACWCCEPGQYRSEVRSLAFVPMSRFGDNLDAQAEKKTKENTLEW